MSNCYTMEAKKFEARLNEIGITYNQFKELSKLHEELTLAGKAEVADVLTTYPKPPQKKKEEVMNLTTLTEEEKKAVVEFMHYVKATLGTYPVFLIGSKARGDHKEDSDVDLVILAVDDVDILEDIDFKVKVLNATYGVILHVCILYESAYYLTKAELVDVGHPCPWIVEALETDGIKLTYKNLPLIED